MTFPNRLAPLPLLLLAMVSAEDQRESRNTPSGDPQVSAIHFSDPTVCHLAGFDGAIFRSSDNGATWVAAPRVTNRNLRALHFTDHLTGIAVGDSGALIRTVNGGASWAPVSIPIREDLTGIEFPEPALGFVFGSSGSILKTQDGGATWKSVHLASGKALQTLSFPDARTGFATGNGTFLLKTDDGGESWQSLPIGFVSPEDGISRIIGNHFPDARSGYLSVMEILVSGSGKHVFTTYMRSRFKTGDGGMTWNRTTPDVAPRPGQYLKDGTAFSLFDGRIHVSTDRGESWTPAGGFAPAPITGSSPFAFHFANRDTGAALGHYGAMFWTRDGGKSWMPAQLPALPSRIGTGAAMAPRAALGLLPGGRVWFELERPSYVVARVFDARGGMRMELLRRTQGAGRHMLALPVAPCGTSACYLDFRSDGFRKALPLVADQSGRP